MAEIEIVNESEAPNMVLENTRKLMLAGVGAVMMARDEMTALAQKFVEQGESTEKKGRQRLEKAVDTRKKEVKKNRKQLETRWNKRTEKLLNRMNIPTHSEIKALNNKITRLTKKVDELAKSA
ncbi:MAG: phasin family protein [Anaerolineae bacterium]